MTDVWSSALEGLEGRLDPQAYDVWIRPIVLSEVDGDLLRLKAPSRFFKEWFESHYLGLVLEEIERRAARAYRVEIEIQTPTAPPPDPKVPRSGDPSPDTPPFSASPPSGLWPRYRFDTFIKGTSNELAASAACAVAEDPARRFNPLFIYGGVGLGKTHLLHAIGHALAERHPHWSIVYRGAERFMNDFISAVRHNQFDEFRACYREHPHALLVDDIQFIAGRDRTMDEFFHVFNVLYEAGKQIVVAADRVPSEMDGMEERLTSRLNWGLVADIKPPDLETRVAILRQKAERERIIIPDDVVFHLADTIRSNVRDLEGALIRVATFASLRGVQPTEQLARDLLGSFSPATRPAGLTVEAIQKTVAHHFSVRIADLKGSRRHRGVSHPRMIAMYLSRELTGSSYPEIGLRFGGRDHSTVISACRRIDAIQQQDPQLRATLATIRNHLR